LIRRKGFFSWSVLAGGWPEKNFCIGPLNPLPATLFTLDVHFHCRFPSSLLKTVLFPPAGTCPLSLQQFSSLLMPFPPMQKHWETWKGVRIPGTLEDE
jgi:hypothetical protein